ncbi:MAG TPA: aldo/keto reductase [Motilibacterales bacterium]|nr:aldo/keto reductase [Motilibacterales bacterium]
MATIRRAHAAHPITALNSEYSLFTRDLETDILPTLRKLGIGLVAYSPPGRGRLTGALTAGSLDDGDFRVNAYPRFRGGAGDANRTLVQALVTLADRLGCTAGQMALAWVLAQGPDIVPIPGTKRVRYLEENAGASEVVLSPEDLATIEAAVPADAVMGDRYADMSSIDR